MNGLRKQIETTHVVVDPRARSIVRTLRAIAIWQGGAGGHDNSAIDAEGSISRSKLCDGSGASVVGYVRDRNTIAKKDILNQALRVQRIIGNQLRARKLWKKNPDKE